MIDEIYYADEATLKQYLRDLIEGDFEIEEEVEGQFLSDGSPVRIDFLIRPRPHLIEQGFGNLLLGVEVKTLSEIATHLMKRKAVRTAWQAITYRLSRYHGEVPDAVLIFPGLDVFEAQPDFPASLDAVTALLMVANVGYLQVGQEDGQESWEVRFGTTRYFHQLHGRGYFAQAGLNYTVGTSQRPGMRLREAS